MKGCGLIKLFTTKAKSVIVNINVPTYFTVCSIVIFFILSMFFKLYYKFRTPILILTRHGMSKNKKATSKNEMAFIKM